MAKLLGGPIMAATFAIRNPDGQTYGLCFLLSAVSEVVLIHPNKTDSDADADIVCPPVVFELESVKQSINRPPTTALSPRT